MILPTKARSATGKRLGTMLLPTKARRTTHGIVNNIQTDVELVVPSLVLLDGKPFLGPPTAFVISVASQPNSTTTTRATPKSIKPTSSQYVCSVMYACILVNP